MARVPLIQEQDHPGLAELIGKLRAGRRGKLINIYRMLLNSPALAESWFNHSNAVRWKTTLDGRLREIVIIRHGPYHRLAIICLRQHVPALALADGLTCGGMRCACGLAGSRDSSIAREGAASAYADTMTRNIAVPEPSSREVKRHFDDRSRRIDRPHRQLQYECARAAGTRARPREPSVGWAKARPAPLSAWAKSVARRAHAEGTARPISPPRRSEVDTMTKASRFHRHGGPRGIAVRGRGRSASPAPAKCASATRRSQ